MLDAALHTRPTQFNQPWSAQSYGEEVSLNAVNSYAARLIESIQDVTRAFVSQRRMHITIGQVSARPATDHGILWVAPSASSSVPDAAVRQIWTDLLTHLCTSGQEDAALKLISMEAERFKAKERFAQLSADLERFHLAKLSDLVLVALLRNTFSIRSHIPYWDTLLEKTENLLQKRERNPRQLLRGLRPRS